MTQWAWSARSCGGCARAEPTTDEFRRCCFERISPLYWRIPIFLWALTVISWSVSSFWGPVEMFLLYMTHWGLLMIVLESAFGIAMCMKKPSIELNGKLLQTKNGHTAKCLYIFLPATGIANCFDKYF